MTDNDELYIEQGRRLSLVRRIISVSIQYLKLANAFFLDKERYYDINYLKDMTFLYRHLDVNSVKAKVKSRVHLRILCIP